MAYNVLIKGFKTKAEAETFASWYDNQGEQDISIWLECRQSEGIIEVSSMSVVKPYNKWEDDTTLEMHINPK
jgi:hypothetical protein